MRDVVGPLVESDRGSRAAFASEVRQALSCQPRQLPSRYFYDELGLALFEAICRLPWYAIARTETALLARHGADILATVEPLGQVVELGSGGYDLAHFGRAQGTGSACPAHRG